MDYETFIENLSNTVKALENVEGFTKSQIASYLFAGRASSVSSVEKAGDGNCNPAITTLMTFAKSINCKIAIALIDVDTDSEQVLAREITEHNRGVFNSIMSADFNTDTFERTREQIEKSEDILSKITENNENKFSMIPRLCIEELEINGNKSLKDPSVLKPSKPTIDRQDLDISDESLTEYFNDIDF
jgi:hypothetical protein